MKRYNELTTVDRGNPCVEYPGEWIVYYNDHEDTSRSFDSLEAAYLSAQQFANVTEFCPSVNWAASPDDPRVGEVWFTGFYRHGKFDQFGRYSQ
jgi:hypothetical protein